MADWFDASDPADSELDGSAAEHIRALKTELNTLDGVVANFSSDNTCVMGWPRTFSVTSYSALPAAGTEGRLAYAEDTRALYHDTGSAWERVEPGPIDVRIPLWFGPSYRFTNSGAAASLGACYTWNPSTLVWAVENWGSTRGVTFNKASYPENSTIKLAVYGWADVVNTAVVKVCNCVTGAAVDITGGSVYMPVTTLAEIVSADLRSAMATGTQKLQLYGTRGSANYYNLMAAELRIERS